ncbi:S41 family peptidase [Pontibacter sp. G13]|uniref:S41 family peptidase n=1 Tax=Pontibacter sp. G13 TaxID=3074898 RepID=UPI0028891532|nr:S41 family peptidase [Pontibacter sp. G13]WNJ21423.1 S41 family peptidase [Pontibacter sp. G13]
MKFARFTIWLVCMGMLMPAFAQDAPSWMRYPAISPDGSTIVFSYKGDLFRVPATGGNAIPLTLHQAHDYMPVWAPDGQHIAFASDRHGNMDVYQMAATGGKPTRLTHYSYGDYPTAYRPDGKVWFTSGRLHPASSAVFPSRGFKQLHEVAETGGRPEMILPVNLDRAIPNASGTMLIYQDHKGYEDYWRKHHTSAVTRDLWMYDVQTGAHTQLTDFAGEDREPVWSADEQSIYFLSERSGTFNVWKMDVDGSNPTQITTLDKHPVRFLSMATDGTLCFAYAGEIFSMKEGENPQKVAISISIDDKYNEVNLQVQTSGANEMAVSPNGKEVAFIIRGEVFVTSVEGGMTKRITETPEQERSVSFSPDGRKLLYASEREGSWNVYETSMAREDDPYFYASTILEEKVLVDNGEETFQPAYAPNGKEVAFLENRTTLRVLNLESNEIRTVLAGEKNYSYSDGDQWYEWSPDGNWFLVTYLEKGRWVDEVGLVNASGTEPIINLTESGYGDYSPKWMMDGKMMLWFSDRRGMRSHGSWGSQSDAFGMFFTQDAWDKFRLSKEEYALMKEVEGKKKKKEDSTEETAEAPKKKKKGKKAEPEEATETPNPWAVEIKLADSMKFEMEGIEDRVARLTIHSSSLADAVVSPDGSKIYYLSSFEKGHDLWVHDFRKRETKILTKMSKRGGGMLIDKKGENLFVINGGSMMKISTKDGKKKGISFKAEMDLNSPEERAYMFEHMWRQVSEKFYDPELHGVAWADLKGTYQAFLPHINNKYDFSEMMSELLGELNGSHTGCRYYHRDSKGDQTAALGFFPDAGHTGDGILIDEIMDKSPLLKADGEVEAGHIIMSIDGETIDADANYYAMLNHKAGDRLLLGMQDPSSGKTWEIIVKAISMGQESELLYQRWVKTRRAEVDRLSNGTVGYVHVRGMNDASFREVYSEVLGRYADKEALVVDTRYNGGGWLHDDLATFLSGKTYVTIEPRGQKIGSEPQNKWSNPSAVLVGEGNYSDAHFFPYVYKTLGIGKLVGMPVPGTTTAVWWERQVDPSLVFGIPQVGVKGLDGQYLENQQLEPDVKVRNEADLVMEGRDQQLEKAVEVMIEEAQMARNQE